jgi:hypothetical protein
MAILTAVLLAGCASQSTSEPASGPLPTGQVTYWDILRTQFEDHMETDSYSKIPPDVRHKISGCMADYVVDNVTPAQLRHLDAVAAGTETPDPDLTSQLDRQVTASIDKLDGGDLALLKPYCPDDVSSFEKYSGQ